MLALQRSRESAGRSWPVPQGQLVEAFADLATRERWVSAHVGIAFDGGGDGAASGGSSAASDGSGGESDQGGGSSNRSLYFRSYSGIHTSGAPTLD